MRSIYVVEDDTDIREIEMFALTNSGYATAGFERAADFFKEMAKQKPELILLDIMLPAALRSRDKRTPGDHGDGKDIGDG